MEEKKVIKVEVENSTSEKRSCCADGSCSICQKRKKLEEDAKNFDEKKEVITKEERIVPDKIRIERDRVANFFSDGEDELEENMRKTDESDKKLDDFMTKTEHKVSSKTRESHHKNYKKHKKSSKKTVIFLVLLIIFLLAAICVSVFFAYKYFNNFKDQVIFKNTFDSRIVELENGETWVRYDEKQVNLEVFYSESCGEDCNTDSVVSFLRSKIPTLEIKKTNVDSSENRDLNYVPFYAFDESVINTEFYNKSKDLFVEKDGKYIFDAVTIGFPIGKYLGDLSKSGFVVGNEKASVNILAIVDFSCESCAISHPILDKLESEYEGKLKFTYKMVTDTEDENLNKFGLAAFCADDQDGFDAFLDIVFTRQENWMAYTGDIDTVLANYAVSAKLNKADFIECVTDKKFEKEVEEMNQELQDFGITDVPVYFIDGEKVEGVVTYTSMKQVIDEVLGSDSDSKNSSKTSTKSTN